MRNDGGVKVGRDFNAMQISLHTQTVFFRLGRKHELRFIYFIADMAMRIALSTGAA